MLFLYNFLIFCRPVENAWKNGLKSSFSEFLVNRVKFLDLLKLFKLGDSDLSLFLSIIEFD
jgi:hypothetical protein